MDFADILLNRINNDSEMKKINNALLCFSSIEVGKSLHKLGVRITWSKAEKASITLLFFISKEEEMEHKADMDEFQHRIIDDFTSPEEKEKVTLRLFVRSSEDCFGDIKHIAEEQNCNLIILGVSTRDICPESIRKFSLLKSDPACSDSFILEQFNKNESTALKTINTLFSRNEGTTALFMDNGFTQLKKIFVPILHKNDMSVFTYIHRIAYHDEIKIMVWDAIGIITSDPKMQKFFQSVLKKTEGHLYLWDNNKKISCDFIAEQDLIVTGTAGWGKLICTPLQWTNCLPSTLIIKEQNNSDQL